MLSPELDPAWRMVSEYALGDYGRVLALLFLAWALSCVALFFAIRSQIRTAGGKIGLGFLLAAALGMSMARNPAWSPARRRLLWTANLTWISLALFTASVFIGLSQTGGEFGPGMLVGWFNRLLVAAYCAWLIAAAWAAERLREQGL